MAEQNSGGGNPCEWNAQLATDRLLKMIRRNQAYCTETHCFNPEDCPCETEGTGECQGTLVLGLILGFLVTYFLMQVMMRMRRRVGTPTFSKSNMDQQGPGGAGGNPPPPALF